MYDTARVIEAQRLVLQRELDSRKTQAERNELGQFSTPDAIAHDMLAYASTLLGDGRKVCFLDPAVGTGVFFLALRKSFPEPIITKALGYEIDPHYGLPSTALWANSNLEIKLEDFTKAEPSPRFNLIICNPPYVRHHHLVNGEKARLKFRTYNASGMRVSGLAGLYCHFLGLSHAWMAENGVAGWLIPSEFMDVNYGAAVKHYLLNQVTLLHIHRFDPSDVQFADALVSSAIVWFRKAQPPQHHQVLFTHGGTLSKPITSRILPVSVLSNEAKWTHLSITDTHSRASKSTLSDFFHVKRGLVTGDNKFFILDAKQIESLNLPWDVFRPILPSPRYLANNEINADANGLPILDHQLFLLDTRIAEEEIKTRFPSLHSYLERGRSLDIQNRYICRHRKPWYSQESRPPAPIVCTYLGRIDTKNNRPFRFILNHSVATVANVYLAMYPKVNLALAMERDSTLICRIWSVLNEIASDHLTQEGRVYGGGLYKLEPNELANVDATSIAVLLPKSEPLRNIKQINLFGELI